MQIFNWEKKVKAEYNNDGGRETVSLTGEKLKFEDVYGGTTLLSYTHPLGETGIGNLEETMFDRRPVQCTRTEAGGLQRLEIVIPEPTATVGFAEVGAQRMRLWTFAVRLGRFNGLRSLWLVFLRPPAGRFTYTPGKPSLSVAHDSSELTAALGSGPDGIIEAGLTLSGDGYRKGELLMRRTIKRTIFDETIGEVKSGTTSLAWRPSRHDFDCMMVFRYGMEVNTSDGKLVDLFRAIGGRVGRGNRYWRKVQDFVPNDGPGIAYSLILKGHRRLSSDEDRTTLTVSG